VTKGTNEDLLERALKAYEAVEKASKTFEDLARGIAPPKKRTAAAQVPRQKTGVRESSSFPMESRIPWTTEEEAKVQSGSSTEGPKTEWNTIYTPNAFGTTFGAENTAVSARKPAENTNLLDLFENPQEKKIPTELANLAAVDFDFTTAELQEEGPKTAQFLKESEAKPPQLPVFYHSPAGHTTEDANFASPETFPNKTYPQGSALPNNTTGFQPATQFYQPNASAASNAMQNMMATMMMNSYAASMRGHAGGFQASGLYAPTLAPNTFQSQAPSVQTSFYGSNPRAFQTPSPTLPKARGSPNHLGISNMISMSDGSHHLKALNTQPVLRDQQGKPINNPNAFAEIDDMFLLKK
jgi:hypothetical protein